MRARAEHVPQRMRDSGVIENMSHFICPDCGSRHDVRHGGAAAEVQVGAPFLARYRWKWPFAAHRRWHAGRRQRTGRPTCRLLQGNCRKYAT